MDKQACPKRTNKFDQMGQAYINLNLFNLKGNQSIHPVQSRDRPTENESNITENKNFNDILCELGYLPERCSYRFASDPPTSEDDFANFDEISRETRSCIIPYGLFNEKEMEIALRFLCAYSYYEPDSDELQIKFINIVIGILAETACADRTLIQGGYVLGRSVVDKLNSLIQTSTLTDCLWSFKDKWEMIVAETKIKNPRSYLKSTLINWLSDYKLEDFRYAY